MVLFTTSSVLFMQYCSSPDAGSLPRAVTMADDIEAAVLRARLEAIVKEAEDAEAQAAATRRHVQAARLLPEEESKAAALEQTATATHQRVPSSSSSSSSPAAASQLVPTASSTYEDTVVAELHLQAAALLNVRQLVNIVLDSSTNYASMWRLIFILSKRRLPSVKSASSMSRRHRSSPTSSRRVSPPRCLMSFGPVSTSAVTEL
jgi:hypothetical protein